MVGNTINWFKLRGFTRRGTTVKAGEGECLAWTGMIKQVLQGPDSCKEQDKGE